jgi:hypothetical protein
LTGAAGVDLLEVELTGIGHSSSPSSQTVGIALMEVQTLVELEAVTVHHSVSYLVVVFHPLATEEEEEEEELLLLELGFGQ